MLPPPSDEEPPPDELLPDELLPDELADEEPPVEPPSLELDDVEVLSPLFAPSELFELDFAAEDELLEARLSVL